MNDTFICTERKWTQWTKRSFPLNGNECSERNVHLKWTEMNVENEPFSCKKNFWTLRSFFAFISVHFWVFGHFWATFDPKKAFFWSFLGTFGAWPNQMNETFIFNERKWTQWTKRSFSLNGNERRECNVHFQWTEMNARTKRSFKMNGCPTLHTYVDCTTKWCWILAFRP